MNGSAAERFGALGITPDAINPADALQLAKQLSWSELSEASAAAGKAYMRDPSPNVRGPGPLSDATRTLLQDQCAGALVCQLTSPVLRRRP